jgi:hypothetical protein
VIIFKDINVKECLLSSSTINPDGTREITYNEAKNSNITLSLINNIINGDTNITSFTELQYFPKSSIPNNFLAGCSSLTEVNFPPLGVLKTNQDYQSLGLGTNILNNSGIKKLNLEGITSMTGTIGGNVTPTFGSMPNLIEVNIKGITNFTGNVFVKNNVPNVEKVIISSLEQWCSLGYNTGVNNDDGVGFVNNPACSGKAWLYIGDNNENNKVTNFIIPNSVSTIRPNCFRELKLSKITFNHNVSADKYSFRELSSDVDFEGIDDYLVSIGESAFYNCKSTNLIVPSVCTSVGISAFYGTKITSINSTKLKTIANNAFDSCYYLTSINIDLDDKSTPVSIGESAFKDTTTLTTVYINKLSYIPKNCFSGSKLTTGTFIGITSIGESAFFNCSRLTTITTKDPNTGINTVIRIESFAFSNATSLSSIDVEFDKCTYLGRELFANNRNIQIPTTLTNLTKIGRSSVSNCKMTGDTVTLPYINNTDVNNLKGVTFEPGSAFYNNYASPFPTNITKIAVPSDLLTWYQTNWANVLSENTGLDFVTISN